MGSHVCACKCVDLICVCVCVCVMKPLPKTNTEYFYISEYLIKLAKKEIIKLQNATKNIFLSSCRTGDLRDPWQSFFDRSCVMDIMS